jgi:hypothetical protein
MGKKGTFVWGVIVGVGGTWAYHAFFKKLPTSKG